MCVACIFGALIPAVKCMLMDVFYSDLHTE